MEEEQSVEKRQRKWEGKTKRILRKRLLPVVGTRKKRACGLESPKMVAVEKSPGG